MDYVDYVDSVCDVDSDEVDVGDVKNVGDVMRSEKFNLAVLWEKTRELSGEKSGDFVATPALDLGRVSFNVSSDTSSVL